MRGNFEHPQPTDRPRHRMVRTPHPAAHSQTHHRHTQKASRAGTTGHIHALASRLAAPRAANATHWRRRTARSTLPSSRDLKPQLWSGRKASFHRASPTTIRAGSIISACPARSRGDAFLLIPHSMPATGDGPRRVIPTNAAPITFYLRDSATWLDFALRDQASISPISRAPSPPMPFAPGTFSSKKVPALWRISSAFSVMSSLEAAACFMGTSSSWPRRCGWLRSAAFHDRSRPPLCISLSQATNLRWPLVAIQRALSATRRQTRTGPL